MSTTTTILLGMSVAALLFWVFRATVRGLGKIEEFNGWDSYEIYGGPQAGEWSRLRSIPGYLLVEDYYSERRYHIWLEGRRPEELPAHTQQAAYWAGSLPGYPREGWE